MPVGEVWSRESIAKLIEDVENAVAVIRTNTYEEAKEISIAAIEGGMKIIEVTMSVPNAPKLIKELKEAYQGTSCLFIKQQFAKFD